jgi:hypothetical protein
MYFLQFVLALLLFGDSQKSVDSRGWLVPLLKKLERVLIINSGIVYVSTRIYSLNLGSEFSDG